MKECGNVSVQDLIAIGKALKKVDRSTLSEWSAVCGDKINFNHCSILWDSFEPIACDVHNTAYSQTRDAFIKLLRPGVDYKEIFQDVVHRKLAAEGADLADMNEDDRKAVHANMSLTKRDMTKVLRMLGIAMKPGDMRVLIDAFDENGDGVVTLTEFMNFVGPKRDKRGGTSMSLNQKCCWSTTCQLTGMANAYSVSPIDKRTAKARQKTLNSSRASEGIAKLQDEFADVGISIDGSNLCQIIELNNGEFRLKVELKERKRREEILKSYGLLQDLELKRANLESTQGGHGKTKDDNYDDDFDNGSPDAHATYDDDFVQDDDKDKLKPANRCSFVTWEMDRRLEGLKWLFAYTQVAREEAELNAIIANGKAPKKVDLTVAPLSDAEVDCDDEALCRELLIRWTPAASDLVSFFSLESSGQVGTGKAEGTFTEVCRDPPDASSDFEYKFWLKGLVPGATYNFRMRAFNGYGPGEYTYKAFTTRPIAPTTPRVIFLSADAVSLRWVFGKGFNARMAELKRIFEAADADGSGNVNRCGIWFFIFID